jgi:uncharacterized coiled-coil DUF342 family protein
MPMIFEALRSRARSAEATALETIAAAARAVAAGGNANIDSVEKALAVVGKQPADFEAAVALARRRAEWLALVDKLQAAKSKATKTETTLVAENNKFIETRNAFAERAQLLQFELDEANQAIRDGSTARERLLDPANVPGGVAAEYAEAFKEAREAGGQRDNAEHRLTELERRLAAVGETVEKIAGTPAEEIDPKTWKAPEGVPEWQADGHGGELDKKLRQWREIRRDRDAMRTTLAEASKTASTWQKKRDALAQEIIKS